MYRAQIFVVIECVITQINALFSTPLFFQLLLLQYSLCKYKIFRCNLGSKIVRFFLTVLSLFHFPKKKHGIMWSSIHTCFEIKQENLFHYYRKCLWVNQFSGVNIAKHLCILQIARMPLLYSYITEPWNEGQMSNLKSNMQLMDVTDTLHLQLYFGSG